MNTTDKYLFQAMDYYPFSLGEATESLGYALSYDAQNTMALCLSGRVQAEQLLNYEKAKEFFEQALGINLHALEIYPHYIDTLIMNGDYDEAEKLIDFALTVKGIDKPLILWHKVLLFETRQEFKAARKVLQQVRLHLINDWVFNFMEQVEKRLDKKIELSKKKKKKAKKGKKKSK
ncbi:tetratricopeptide repeat protein [Flavobacterium sp.]|uniref:tetratricopeptide repeat protein n=1 Tax=Flavobacterium sp. TaxID=239 RepID=UPI0039E5CF58